MGGHGYYDDDDVVDDYGDDDDDDDHDHDADDYNHHHNPHAGEPGGMWSHKLATFGMPSVSHWRNWNRKNYDYSDSDYVCPQYHTGTTGTVIMKFQKTMVVIMMLFAHICHIFDTGRKYSKVRSFNFLSSSYDHLQSQDYTVSSSFSLLPYFPYFQTIFSYFDRPACMYTNTYLYQYQYLRNTMIIPILFVAVTLSLKFD